MLQSVFVLILFVLLILPIGKYLYHIITGQHTFADPLFDRVDGLIYKLVGLKKRGMTWKKYAMALILTNGIMMFIGYLILRLQALPILNPNGISSMSQSLSFNTVISFVTNTNL